MRVFYGIQLLAVTAAILLWGCNNEEISDELNPIGWGSVETKSYEFKVSDVQSLGINIRNGQSVTVFSTDAPDDNRQFVYNESAFTGEAATTGSFFALYPYTANATFTYKDSLPIVKTTVPEELSLKQNVQISKSEAVSDASEVTDLAVGRFAEDGVKFQSVYTGISFNIESEYAYHIDSIRISGNNNEKMSGVANIEITDSIPVVTFAETAEEKIVYKCNIDIEKNGSENVTMSLIPIDFAGGFKVELFNGTAAKEIEYDAIDIRYGHDNVISDVKLKMPEYYIEYSSPSEIILAGYLSEYSNGSGKIFFETPNVPAGLLNGQTSVTEVIVPAEITSVGDNAFSGMTSLESIEFGNVVLTYDDVDTEKVTDVTSDSKLETLGYNVFDGSNVSSIVLPATIKDISGSFNGLNTEYTIYSLAVTPPTTNAQSFSESLNFLFVPESSLDNYRETLAIWYKKIFAIGGDTSEVPSVETDYYIYYKSEKKLEINPGIVEEYNHIYDEINQEGYIYFKEPKVPVSFMENIIFDIYEMTFVGIEEIGESAFAYTEKNNNYTFVDKISFNEGLLTIGDNAFKNVDLQDKLQIPCSVKEIGVNAFSRSTAKEIYIGEVTLESEKPIVKKESLLEKVGEGCFTATKDLETVVIASSVIKELKGAFNSPFNGLSLYFTSFTPPLDYKSGISFDDYFKKAAIITIYVPSGSKESYSILEGDVNIVEF